MRKRRSRGISGWEDIDDSDSRYRAGRALYDLFSKTPQKRKAEYYENKYEEGEQRQPFFPINPPVQAKRNQSRIPGNKIMPFNKRGRARSYGRKPRRKVLGRSRSRSRSRSRVGRMHRKRRRVAGGRFKRGRFGGRRLRGSHRGSAWLRKYKRVTPPLHLKAQYTTNMTKAGDNVQNKCSWHVFGQFLEPVVTDILYNRATQRERSTATVPSFAGPFPTPATTVDVELDPTVADNVYAPTYTSSNYHISETKCLVSHVKHWFQLKNQANKRCDITIFLIRPRRDTPVAWEGASSFLGTDPVWIQRMFANTHNPPILTTANGGYLFNDRLQAWDEHNASLFMSDTPKFFKIKQLKRLFLEPGGWKKFVFHKRKPTWFNKTTDGVDTNGTYGATWNWLKKMGSLIVIRSQGSQIQNSASAGTNNPNTNNTAIAMSMSGYNVQLFREEDWYFRGLGQNMAKRKRAFFTDALPSNFTLANEQNFEAQVPAAQPMAIDQ